jgi:maleylacetate reductase
MHSFCYQPNASRIVFGAGALQQVSQEVEALGARRALVISTPEQQAQAQCVVEMLGPLSVGLFSGAAMHVPIESVREVGVVAERLSADCAVTFGGGSATGLGKAMALESGLPILSIPTTYAGSEVTTIYGITEGGVKKTGRDLRVLPRTVIYDPELSIGLPLTISITSALNAVAHAAEALYAQDRNPITNLMAQEGVRAIATALPSLVAQPSNLVARGDALYGAWLCGTVLSQAAMGLHHKLCHTLGGMFNLPHAEMHAILLPYVLDFNAPGIGDALTRLGRALPGPGPVQAILRLQRLHAIPLALRELGMPEEGIARAVDQTLANPYVNPQPLDREGLQGLLSRAWAGDAAALSTP